MTTKFKKHDRVLVISPTSYFYLKVGWIWHTSTFMRESRSNHYVYFGTDEDSDGRWFYEDDLQKYLNGVERMIECLK
jgi:hypothetical protein